MALTVVPEEPRSLIDACHITVAGAEQNRGPDETGGPFGYYIELTAPSGVTRRSHTFNVGADGEHTWDGFIFDESGTWDVVLHDLDDDSAVESDTFEVS